MTCSSGMIGRLLNYSRRHGLRATFSRGWLSFQRAWLGTRMVLYECSLNAKDLSPLQPLTNATLERKNTATELSPDDLHRITTAWNTEQAKRLHAERFTRGASLWLLKVEGRVAAYGWTIKKETIEPHFFPLGQNDAHLFDFFVFPEYRGRRLNPLLVNHILARLALENTSRAFIEAAEWNTAQLSSLGRTFFRKLGYARKLRILGRTVVVWSHGK